MLETICSRVLDILAADARLSAGGNAYTAGWSGVKRIEAGDAPAADYINLFDEPYEPDSATARPGIYVGSARMEATDRLDYPAINAGKRVEYRIALVPLVIVVQGATKYSARNGRNQLRGNVHRILMDHLIEPGAWYELTVPGEQGGGAASARVWATSTGGGNLQEAEATAVLPLQIRYSWSSTAPS